MEQLNQAIELAANMLKKLENPKGKWTDTDDKKLQHLTKLVNVLAKLMPFEEKKQEEKKKPKTTSSKQDAEIIRKFLARKKK